MEINSDVVTVLLGFSLAGIAWLFKKTHDQDKEIVRLDTKSESTNFQVREIKNDIETIKDQLKKNSDDSTAHMIQMLENISQINTNIARIKKD